MENKLVILKIWITTTPTGNPFVVMMKRKVEGFPQIYPTPSFTQFLNKLALLYTILAEGGGGEELV